MAEATKQQLQGLLLRLKRFGWSHEWLETAARVGWVSRGVLYLILGSLATLAAVGEGGGLHDGKGVVRWILSLPAGTLLVALSACGFAGYAIYSAALMCFGQENTHGALASVIARLKGAIGCIVHGSLTFTSVQLLLGHDKHGDDKRVWIATLLMQPWGRVLIGILGVSVIGFGIYQCVYAVSAKHRDEVNSQAMSANERSAFLWIGRAGLISRGFVFGVLGYFALRAAIKAAPGGTDTSTSDALREIRDVGWAPLAVIALGLAAYGVLQLFYAKYRKIELA
ncbi:MAG TPA: DUF1206 domain-containing protein [Polyangiales bacterium]|jgi:hypothetical protein|nr:DUF1206 domain-containing protein [Polyangiales bacterium]